MLQNTNTLINTIARISVEHKDVWVLFGLQERRHIFPIPHRMNLVAPPWIGSMPDEDRLGHSKPIDLRRIAAAVILPLQRLKHSRWQQFEIIDLVFLAHISRIAL